MKKRTKIYYPDNQIIKGLFTSGSEFEDENGKEYIGHYHTYVNDAIYSGYIYVKNKSFPLQPIQDITGFNATYTDITNEKFLIDKNIVEINTFVNEHYVPSSEDYKNGYYTRYIIKRKNAKEFKETTKTSYELLEKNKKFLKFFTLFAFNWYFKTPTYDYIKDGIIIVKGSYDENMRTLLELNKIHTGIKQFTK